MKSSCWLYDKLSISYILIGSYYNLLEDIGMDDVSSRSHKSNFGKNINDIRLSLVFASFIFLPQLNIISDP